MVLAETVSVFIETQTDVAFRAEYMCKFIAPGQLADRTRRFFVVLWPMAFLVKPLASHFLSDSLEISN